MIEGTANGDGPDNVGLGRPVCCGETDWNPPPFANGFVGERLRDVAPVGFPRSLGSAIPPIPVGWGIMDWRKGFVDVVC